MARRVSDKTVARLSAYRRVLSALAAKGNVNVYSHQLAKAAGATPAQVRRDLMCVGYTGSPNKGYDIAALTESITEFLDGPTVQPIALVGVGNLGRAILAYFAGRNLNLRITAAFDKDPEMPGRVFHGCRCYSIADAPTIIPREGIRTAILAVPAKEAQLVADILLAAGVKGILNFAPAHLRVGLDVCVENMDFTISLEKVAFFARTAAASMESERT